MPGESPEMRPARSPAGERFDPPVRAIRFGVERRLAGAEVARELAALPTAAIGMTKRLLDHAGR